MIEHEQNVVCGCKKRFWFGFNLLNDCFDKKCICKMFVCMNVKLWNPRSGGDSRVQKKLYSDNN